MPDKVKNTGKSHSCSEFHMPFENSFYKWQVPFIGDLKGHKYAGKGGGKESNCKNEVPELLMELAGNEAYPAEEVT
jgi:hypothetical protein